MTIVKSTQYLKNHPFIVINEDAADEILSQCPNRPESSHALKLFECFCDITQQNVSFLTLQHPSFVEVVYRFIGALFSGSFCEQKGTTVWNFAHAFFVGAVKNNPFFEHSYTPKDLRQIKDGCIQAWHSKSQNIDAGRAAYWGGFQIESRKGHISYLPLQGVHEKYSPDFAHEIHKHVAQHALSMSRINMTMWGRFLLFITNNSDRYKEYDFKNSFRIERLFKDFMKYAFLEAHRKSYDIVSYSKAWNTWCTNLEEALLKSDVWSSPVSNQLPRARTPTVKGSQTRIRKNDEGVEVKQKLITDVPLSITDSEAIKLLFKQVNDDIDVVVKWATYNATAFWERYQKRTERAKHGIVINGISNKKTDEELLCDISKTFEIEGFKNRFAKKFEPRFTAADLIYELGLPRGSFDFDSYKILLVSEHPAITTEFLSDLELYDKKGNLAGFYKLDGITYLTGYKDRRGKDLAEQTIKLNEKSIKWVEQIIELTAPLRKRLKAENDDKWRRLFLSSGGKFGTPTITRYPAYNATARKNGKSYYNNVYREFSMFTDRKGEDLHNFMYRVSLSTVRASVGVSIYLETMSVTEMAQALGHARYDPELLEHYLPEPILAFFQSRWIRIFQKAIICEAMKDSVYLLEATKFRDMDELNEFLENHALKNIPEAVTDNSYQNTSQNDNSQVYFSVDKGVLTALLSLQSAVDSAPDKSKLNEYAIYWDKVTTLIIKEIERGKDRNLKSHLSQAREHINANTMEDLIYATA
ncbi:hypothetical protein NDJ00_11955 [Vibrio parahaemolyticus]|uniref:hypothetical protein n=1 Tax=Vibrio parahaemolyticus TaxID=670 RepID=UPI00215E2D31|nr:hypothetical protein [Vibrio parahaemolyticus]MCS0114885.1 hypothetical protein [Vibrio parahaemolyticus]